MSLWNVNFREIKLENKLPELTKALPICIEAVILEPPTEKSHGVSAFVVFNEELGKIQVKTKANSSLFKAGDTVYFSGKLNLPAPENKNSSFNEKNFFRAQNIYYKLNSAEAIKLLEKESFRSKLIRTIYEARTQFLNIHQALLKNNELILMQKTLFGNSGSRNFDYKTSQVIKNLGVSHVFAASGLHLTALIFFFSYLLSFFKLPNWSRISLLLFFITFYTFLAAWTPSITRAWMLATLVLVGRLANKKANLLNVMLFCLCLTLLWEPNSIGDIGFQLSYLATFGIILWTNKITDKMIFIPRSWAEPLAASLAAQILVFPVQIFYFQNVPLYFLPANLIAVPLSSFILFGGLAASLVSMLSPVGWLLASGIELVNSLLIKLLLSFINLMDLLPSSGLAVERPTFLFTVWLYLLTVYIAFFWKNRVAKHYFMAATSLLFFFSFFAHQEPTLKIKSFSHKTYEAVLLEYKGDKKVFICNTNTRYSAGDHLVRAFAKHNIKSIDNWIGNCQPPSNIPVSRIIKASSEEQITLHPDCLIKLNPSGVLVKWKQFAGLVLLRPVSLQAYRDISESAQPFYSMVKINFHPSEHKGTLWSQLPPSQLYLTPHCSKPERLELTKTLSKSCSTVMDYQDVKDKEMNSNGEEIFFNN
ncbi:MAG: ComEC/Rec2 family competence protein [Candidatus Caenarcaniphilales bacterium]|nr:ComEC/Rec2 family competence protein [Candidatus Caenarcaniphilales bacterium]